MKEKVVNTAKIKSYGEVTSKTIKSVERIVMNIWWEKNQSKGNGNERENSNHTETSFKQNSADQSLQANDGTICTMQCLGERVDPICVLYKFDTIQREGKCDNRRFEEN